MTAKTVKRQKQELSILDVLTVLGDDFDLASSSKMMTKWKLT